MRELERMSFREAGPWGKMQLLGVYLFMLCMIVCATLFPVAGTIALSQGDLAGGVLLTIGIALWLGILSVDGSDPE